MKKLGKLTAVVALAALFGFLNGGAKVEAGDPPGYCSDPVRPSCSTHAECQAWCGPLAEDYFCYRSCCWCTM